MTTQDIVKIALFAAITAALGLFPPLHLPVIGAAITAQSMGVMLAGALLGARRGALSQALFVALVAAGLPLLAGGRGGLGVLSGPSGGFILSWPVAAFLVGLLIARVPSGAAFWRLLPPMIIGGVLLIYAIGIPWVAMMAKIPLAKAAWGSLAFVPGDILKAILAASLTRTLRRAFPTL